MPIVWLGFVYNCCNFNIDIYW